MSRYPSNERLKRLITHYVEEYNSTNTTDINYEYSEDLENLYIAFQLRSKHKLPHITPHEMKVIRKHLGV